MTILVAGYFHTESERAKSPWTGGDEARRDSFSHFFFPPDPGAGASAAADQKASERISRFLDEEQAMASEFVAAPSATRLHRRADPRRIRESDLESFLAEELDAVARFLTDPSVEALHRPASRRVGMN